MCFFLVGSIPKQYAIYPPVTWLAGKSPIHRSYIFPSQLNLHFFMDFPMDFPRIFPPNGWSSHLQLALPGRSRHQGAIIQGAGGSAAWHLGLRAGASPMVDVRDLGGICYNLWDEMGWYIYICVCRYRYIDIDISCLFIYVYIYILYTCVYMILYG